MVKTPQGELKLTLTQYLGFTQIINNPIGLSSLEFIKAN
jgi:hypothetical protein